MSRNMWKNKIDEYKRVPKSETLGDRKKNNENTEK